MFIVFVFKKLEFKLIKDSNIDEPNIHGSSKTIDTNVEQTEPIVDSDVDRNDVSQKELPVQSAHESEEVNTVDKATDVNGDSSKDSDHTIDAENMTVDEPDHILDSVDVNTCSPRSKSLSLNIE